MDLIVGPLIVLIALVGLVVLLRRHGGARFARFLRRVGFALTVLFGGVFGLFLIGDTLSDPGGWKGVGLVALWLIPLSALCLLAWFRPGAARFVFAPLVGAMASISIWFAVAPDAWRAFENRNGPIRAVFLFALALALALWGLRMTLTAGVMLLVLGIVPIAVSSLGHGGMVSLAAASSAPVITGLCYLASTYEARRRTPPAAGAPPSEHPQAA